MALNKLILELEQKKLLNQLLQQGFIGYKIKFYSDIYLTFDSHVKQGKKRSKALQATADQFQVSDETIRKAIHLMEEKTL